jgi:hypothetical protein
VPTLVLTGGVDKLSSMKKLWVPLMVLAALLCGCAALLDGKVVGREGKESSFKSIKNPYEPPPDPTSRY